MAVREAKAALRAQLEALTVALTDRWGETRHVDLWPYLRAGFAGATVPEPIVGETTALHLAVSLRDRDGEHSLPLDAGGLATDAAAAAAGHERTGSIT
ncbi:hypothetical protein [Streptomyces cyanogenus]|uniref:Uncharacterized protein n=1 Tax=Streptomyces cyanogenus TaxID=80860 RepID=A0ABX7THN8_STRCY|nr:hypothetical protein [Streptomyces cyanogenus]QTD95930.1 hypothetical protein S1361_01165 [Streptomyces cyanogenus]